MKCCRGKELVAQAAAFAVEFSEGMDGNEMLAWSDFFGMVTANLIALADRAIYIADPASDCIK